MGKLERVVCVVCKKKRSKKFMNILPQYLTEELNLHKNSYICNINVVWGKSPCKNKFVNNILTKQIRVVKLLKVYTQENNVIVKSLNNTDKT